MSTHSSPNFDPTSTDPTSGDETSSEMATAALILIGNEILSGRTQDINLNYIATRLTAHGIRLLEARVIADDAAAIQTTVRQLSAEVDYVFTTGGIGPTHDDITAENIAAVFSRDLITHPQALQVLQDYYSQRGIELNAARMRMARTPAGATLISNPVSGAPGFCIRNVYVMAGVPQIMQAMFDNVVGTLRSSAPVLSRTIICDLPEGLLAQPLGALQQQFTELDIGCYPGKLVEKWQVSIVLRGVDEQQLQQAERRVTALIKEHDGNLIQV